MGAEVRFERLGDTYQLCEKEGWRLRFDAQGRLLRKENRNGQGFTYNYDTAGRMETVRSDCGRVLGLHYTDGGPEAKISRIEGPGGQVCRYHYRGEQLEGVEDRGGGPDALHLPGRV